MEKDSGFHSVCMFSWCLVQLPPLVWVLGVLWWTADPSRWTPACDWLLGQTPALPVTLSRNDQPVENEWMSKYTFHFACFYSPVIMTGFSRKRLRCHTCKMGQTSKQLNTPWQRSPILLMLVYWGKDTTLDFLIYFNLHYRCTEHWFTLRCICINRK